MLTNLTFVIDSLCLEIKICDCFITFNGLEKLDASFYRAFVQKDTRMKGSSDDMRTAVATSLPYPRNKKESTAGKRTRAHTTSMRDRWHCIVAAVTRQAKRLQYEVDNANFDRPELS